MSMGGKPASNTHTDFSQVQSPCYLLAQSSKTVQHGGRQGGMIMRDSQGRGLTGRDEGASRQALAQ